MCRGLRCSDVHTCGWRREAAVVRELEMEVEMEVVVAAEEVRVVCRCVAGTCAHV